MFSTLVHDMLWQSQFALDKFHELWFNHKFKIFIEGGQHNMDPNFNSILTPCIDACPNFQVIWNNINH